MRDKPRDCCYVLELLEGYAAGTLSESEIAVVEGHLSECEACRAELDLVTTLIEAARSEERAGRGYHLDPELITSLAYTPDTMDPWEKKQALSHISLCKKCREELKMVRQVAADVGLPEVGVAEKPEGRYTGRLLRWLTRPAVPAWATALLVVVVGAFVLYWPRGEIDTLREVDTPPSLFQFAPGEEGSRPEEVGETGRPVQPAINPVVPVVVILGEEAAVRSVDDAGAVLASQAIDIRLAAPGDELYCVIHRPAFLKSERLADVTLVQAVDSGLKRVRTFKNVPLPGGDGPIFLPIPRETLSAGKYILLLGATGVTEQDDTGLVGYHLSVTIE